MASRKSKAKASRTSSAAARASRKTASAARASRKSVRAASAPAGSSAPARQKRASKGARRSSAPAGSAGAARSAGSSRSGSASRARDFSRKDAGGGASVSEAQRVRERARKKGGASKERARKKAGASKDRAAASAQSAPRRPKTKAQLRAEERERRTKSAYKGYVVRILLIIAAVLALLFGAIFVYRSDLFHVDNVKVSGVSHLTDLEITRIAAVPNDSTLLRLDEDGIKQRLSQNAWVQGVEVKRVFPDTVELVIEEREPAAAVRVNEKSTWVVADDGAWLSAATNADWEKDPRIVDVSASISAPVSGLSCDDEGIMNALKVIAALGERTKSELDSVSAPSAAKTSLNLKNGVSVAFGDASEVAAKEAAIWGILDKLAGTVSYINVRVPSRPTYRALGAEDSAQDQGQQQAQQEQAQEQQAQQDQQADGQQEQQPQEQQPQEGEQAAQEGQEAQEAQEGQEAQEAQE